MAVKKAAAASTKKVGSSKKVEEPKKAVSKKAEPVKKAGSKKVEEPPKKGAGKAGTSKSPVSKSLAALWDKESDASKASNMLSEGEHVVRLNSLSIKVDPKKGAAGFLEVEAIDGEEEGRKGRQMYKITDENGDKAAGMDYLARDLALLGYEDVSGDELESTCEEVTVNQPMIVVRVRLGNTGYTNIFVQGLAEDGASNGGDVDGDGEPAEIEVGSRVTFESDGTTYAGEVIKIDGSEARVKTDDGDKYDVDLADLALEEGGGDAGDGGGEPAEIEVGSTVSFDDSGTTRTGEVTKIKGDKATVKDTDGDKYEVDLSDLTIDDGSGDGDAEPTEIEVGSRVSFNDDDTEREGEVIKLSDEDATVKDDDGDKYKVALSDLTLVTD